MWSLADPKLGERDVAAELLAHAQDLTALPIGVVVIGDKGFAGQDFERDMTELGITSWPWPSPSGTTGPPTHRSSVP